MHSTGPRSRSAARHAAGVRSLPPFHGDPFDRLLVVQARVEELRLVTADAAFEPYGVPLLRFRAEA